MEIIEEQVLKWNCSGLSSLEDAFSWIIKMHDREFIGATMVRIEIQQIMVSYVDSPDGWEYRWEATIHGNLDTDKSSNVIVSDSGQS